MSFLSQITTTRNVWLFVPNLIGYTRIISGLAAFAYAYDAQSYTTFFYLYMFSYGLDALDGVAARKLGQTSSFGAVLDMITDRFCTAALLSVLSHVYPKQYLYFVYLMVLDIVSHWVQMYSSLKYGSASHKAVADETFLLRFYYTFPYALFWVCLFNETFLAMLYLLAYQGNAAATSHTIFATQLPEFVAGVFGKRTDLATLIMSITAPVFALKQLISVVQLASAAARIVSIDTAALSTPTTTKAKPAAAAAAAAEPVNTPSSDKKVKAPGGRGRSASKGKRT